MQSAGCSSVPSPKRSLTLYSILEIVGQLVAERSQSTSQNEHGSILREGENGSIITPAFRH